MLTRALWIFIALCLVPAHAKAEATAFSGRATAVSATVVGLPPIVLSDTGAIDSSGGSKEASLLAAEYPGLLKAEVLHAATVGQGDRSRSEASVSNFTLMVGGHTIAAGFLMARAQALCTSNGRANVAGGSEIAQLTIDGTATAVTGEPNQTVDLAGVGKVVINEQNSAAPGDLTVNALHVIVYGVADVVVASAHADVVCRAGACPTNPNDFVTGGGWIFSSSSGDKGTFAVAGGIKNGALWGHLQYQDHGSKLKVKGTSVTMYELTGPTSRHIEGTAEINGVPGTYTVDVSDNGEPGRNDTFVLRLSTGYEAGGKLEGGNIQLHHPCR